jgi:hypothetical protein
MKSRYKLLLRPEKVVILIDYSDELMKKCNKLFYRKNPTAESIEPKQNATPTSRLEGTVEYKRLLKYILGLSPGEVRELKMIVSVGEKMLSTADFVKECNTVLQDEDFIKQSTDLSREVLFESIPRGLDALMQAGVIEES